MVMTSQGSCKLVSENNVPVNCQWVLNDRSTASQKRLCRSLDLILGVPDQQDLATFTLPDCAATKFIRQFLGSFQPESKQEQTAIKLILPESNGFVARSDFLERRLHGCVPVEKVEGFLQPRQEVRSALHQQHEAAGFEHYLSKAIGGLATKPGAKETSQATLNAVEAELDNRLSFAWLSTEPITPKRLVWVEGRSSFESSRQMYEAAWALGITLVVIDKPGHWFSDDNAPFSYLREAFIPLDIDVDKDITTRIIDAVRNYGKPVDGIMSVSDARGPAVAGACEVLGLPTAPLDSYIVAADKYKTRMMELDNAESFRVDSSAALLDRIQSKDTPELKYPLMVKPCMGWGSESTSKVLDQSELVHAVHRASARHKSSPQQRTDVLVEPYIEGPEIDINIVLFEKQVIYFEVLDDFPKQGDSRGEGWTASFQETTIVVPSNLPESEISVARDAVLASLVRQGFHTGTFHCEGRIRHSSMHYTSENNVQDVRPRPAGQSTNTPAFFLHEINARPPGYIESVASHATHGVDYYALQQLFAVGDPSRFQALSQPFLNGAQWWLALVIIAEDREGIMKSEDAGKEMLARSEELRQAVPHYGTVAKRGTKLTGPKAAVVPSWLAYFHVVSRKSREDVLRLEQLVRTEFRYEVE